MSEPPYLEFLYNALRSPLGIIVETDNVERCRAKLYAARREANDPALASLSIVPSPTADNQLWIIKKEPTSGETPESGAA